MSHSFFLKKAGITVFCLLLLQANSIAQSVTHKLKNSFLNFEKDPQLKYAISSLYVVDAQSGVVVFDKNSSVGLAPASTQKIVTSISAYEILGKDFSYRTDISYDGKIVNGILIGNIVVTGSGDPTLGSWRWAKTKEDSVINRILKSIQEKGIRKIDGNIIVDISNWKGNQQMDGWIWQDIGNYYGAGLNSLLWRENQFDIHLQSGKNIGDPVSVIGYTPNLYTEGYQSYVTSAKKGSGDNAYVYILPKEIRGTIPIMENDFVISGSMQNASLQFANTLADSMSRKGFGKNSNVSILDESTKRSVNNTLPQQQLLHIETSPPLDSIIYWFNKKSVNLYGESLMKTIAYQQNGFGSTDSGIKIIKKYWNQFGVDEDELGMVDGSGLSPMNRITTHAQVELLKYAKSKDWFSSFFTSLPEYNNMKMKSGTIRGAKGFCGYHKAKNGKEYIFSFLVNNYNGSATSLVNKMFRVLDSLK